MKRVLQHRKTGLYITQDGRLTADVSRAAAFPSLGDARLACAGTAQNPADFVYRMIDLEPAWLACRLLPLAQPGLWDIQPGSGRVQ